MFISKIVDFAQFGYFIFVNYKLIDIASLNNGELSFTRFILCLAFYALSDFFLIANMVKSIRSNNLDIKLLSGVLVNGLSFLSLSLFKIILKACEFKSFAPPYASLFMALGAVISLVILPFLWLYMDVIIRKYVFRKNILDFEIFEIKEESSLYPTYKCFYKTELDGKEIVLEEKRGTSPAKKHLIPKIGDKVKIGISKEKPEEFWIFDKNSNSETGLGLIRLCFFYLIISFMLFLMILAA